MYGMLHKPEILTLLYSLLFMVITDSAVSQSKYPDIDSFVLSCKNETNYVTLAEKIGETYPGDLQRARAIFRWITAFIKYDYAFVNSGKEIEKPECNDKADCRQLLREWENNFLKKIMKSGKATAEGYAKLFKKMCDLLYIQAETIQGYARTKPYQVGNNMGLNHFWNAIHIDTAWYYIDATWAAGYCTENDEGRLLKFIRSFNEYYWLVPQELFIRNHYPKKGHEVEKMLITKEQFFNKPYYFSIDVLENLREYAPLTGVLKIRKGDSIFFHFSYAKEIKRIQVNSNIFRNPKVWVEQRSGRNKATMIKDEWAEKKQVYIPFIKKENEYSFYVKVLQESQYYIELVFDGVTAIRYRVRVENDRSPN